MAMAKVNRSPVPNFDLDTKMSGTASATSTWLHPPDRPEIIDTLINGVGMAHPLATPRKPLTMAVCRPLQSFKHRNFGGLPLPSDKDRGI